MAMEDRILAVKFWLDKAKKAAVVDNWKTAHDCVLRAQVQSALFYEDQIKQVVINAVSPELNKN